jgi:hypothetical protein
MTLMTITGQDELIVEPFSKHPEGESIAKGENLL